MHNGSRTYSLRQLASPTTRDEFFAYQLAHRYALIEVDRPLPFVGE